MVSPYRVEMTHISKSYGGVDALHDVHFRVRPGVIHALVGENGAGKSTLMKILSGAIQKDEGTIRVDGTQVHIKSPHAARKLGIGIIYQEFTLAPDLSVAENVFLHHMSDRRGLMDWPNLYRRTDRLIRRIGFDINPRRIVGSLSVAYQQVVEITKALSEDVRILILDEPTSVLAPNETERLFDVLRMLQSQDVSIIYISHRLDEIFRIADRITLLKDGRNAGEVAAADAAPDDIIQMMIGRELTAMFPERKACIGEEIFSVKKIQRGKRVERVSFSLRAGEILGITGLVGSGRTELLRAIFSADSKDDGQIFIHQRAQKIHSPRQAVLSGIALVPEDRKNQGVVLPMSVKENITMPVIHTLAGKTGIIWKKQENAIVNDLIQKLQIKAESINTSVSQLSGGNQQKVVLAKWLGSACRVILLDEPTRGVDVGTKVEIYRLINELAARGVGIVMVSSELSEIIGMCDRALVMRDGCIRGSLEKHELTEENIITMSIRGEGESERECRAATIQ